MTTLRYALRSLRRAPTFVFVAVMSLALGIGSAFLSFRALDALFFRAPAGVHDAARVVRLYVEDRATAARGLNPAWTSYPMFRDAQQAGNEAFQGIGAVWTSRFLIGSGTDAREVVGGVASGTLLRLLGVHAVIGRLLDSADARQGAARVAVLSARLWLRRFGGAASVIGRDIDLNGHAFTVIGVTEPGFRGVDREPVDVWVPLSSAGVLVPIPGALQSPGARWLRLIGRLRGGMRANLSAQRLTGSLRVLGDLSPDQHVIVGPLLAARGPYRNRAAELSMWVAALGTLLLLVACANLAGLELARALRRRQEMGMQRALGARTRDVVMRWAFEVGLLGIAAAASALLIAGLGARLIDSSTAVRGAPVELRDVAVLAVLTLFAVGAVSAPTLAVVGRQPSHVLLRLGAGTEPAQSKMLRQVLLIAQFGITVALLVAAVALVHTFRMWSRIDVGFRSHGLVVASPVFPNEYPAAGRDVVLQRMRSQVLASGIASDASLTSGDLYRRHVVVAVSSSPDPAGTLTLEYRVDSHFVHTLGTHLVSGRGFSQLEVESGATVALVNTALARRLWPGSTGLGRCVDIAGARGPTCLRVVGVTTTGRYSTLDEEPTPVLYLPLAPHHGVRFAAALYVRLRGERADAVPLLRRTLRAADPVSTYVRVGPATDAIDGELRAWRKIAQIVTLFGAVALALGAVGLYAAASLLVATQARGLAIRLVLGCPPRRLGALVLRDGALTVLAGCVTGGVAARVAWGAVLRIAPIRPPTWNDFLIVCASLGAIATAALWGPVRRALRVEPSTVLRE